MVFGWHLSNTRKINLIMSIILLVNKRCIRVNDNSECSSQRISSLAGLVCVCSITYSIHDTSDIVKSGNNAFF